MGKTGESWRDENRSRWTCLLERPWRELMFAASQRRRHARTRCEAPDTFQRMLLSDW